MGRFDAQMQKTYLHVSLNRRLQEENVDLAARLKKYVKKGPRLSIEISGQWRGISAGPREYVG